MSQQELPTRFILYVVRTSPSPDLCEGGVPWCVDDQEIFFGPCKKRLRRNLRKAYLGPSRHLANVATKERVIVAGFNAGHGHEPRKIVWAGELLQVMSFAEAWARLDGPRYAKMRTARASPLHAEPVWENGEVRGYVHHGLEHAEESESHPGEFSWWDDLVPRPMRPGRVEVGTRTTLRLRDDVPWWDGFPLDAVLMLRHRFWANGSGLPLDADAIRLLRVGQEAAQDVDASAPFGRDRLGSANGLRGSYLELKGQVAARLAAWLDDRAPPGARPTAPPSAARSRARKC